MVRAAARTSLAAATTLLVAPATLAQLGGISLEDRVAQSAVACATAVSRTQMLSGFVAVAALATVAAAIRWISRRAWVSAPATQWLLFVLTPPAAAGLTIRSALPSLYDTLDQMTEQGLMAVVNSPKYFNNPDVQAAVRLVLDLKVAADEGPYLLWWTAASSPVLLAAMAGTLGCLALWYLTNFRVVEGRFTGRTAGAGGK